MPNVILPLFQAIFGVFDGHGGAKAAEFAAKNLGRNIINEVALRSEDGVEEAVKEGYLTTDTDFLKLNTNGGSCCVTALIQNGQLIVSNAGDCRAVMSRGGVAEALTVDHRPSRQDEMERIQSLVRNNDYFSRTLIVEMRFNFLVILLLLVLCRVTFSFHSLCTIIFFSKSDVTMLHPSRRTYYHSQTLLVDYTDFVVVLIVKMP